MQDRIETRYRALLASGELVPDAAQERAVKRLRALAAELRHYRPGRRRFFSVIEPPSGIYLWGDVGRGKSMLMDLFFDAAVVRPKRRSHFNAFIVQTHARIHYARK